MMYASVTEFLKASKLIKSMENRFALVKSTLSEEKFLPQMEEIPISSEPNKHQTQSFQFETIAMLKATRADQIEQLRSLIAADSSTHPLAPKPGSLWTKLMVGRSPDCNISIQDPAVSSQHAQFELDFPGRPLVLTDLSSTNGSFLNGQRIQPHEHIDVKSGDCIRFGSSIFYVITVPMILEMFH